MRPPPWWSSSTSPAPGCRSERWTTSPANPSPDVGFYLSEIDGRTIGTYYTDEAGIINLPDQEEIWVQVTEIQPAEGTNQTPPPGPSS